MIDRRRFVYTAAAVALFERSWNVFGASAGKYDLILKGGRVIDPASGHDAIRDVAVSGGRVAAVRAVITDASLESIDARGRLVVPGLIDIHTHAGRSPEGPPQILKDGVTGWIDAGSQGADHIQDVVTVAKSSPQPGRILLNIGRAGILSDGDTMDLSRADVSAAKEAIAGNREFIVGIKARLSQNVAGKNDYEVLRRAQEVAKAFNLPVMIHMGQTYSSIPKLFGLLKRGDIVTHMFAPPPNSIIDDSGHILPEVLAARRRGVWFDVGNGVTGHLRWDMVEGILKQRFWPDTISTDWGTNSPTTGVVDFPNCMSKYFGYGMSVSQAIACATSNAARVFPAFKNHGTLKVGAPADITLLDLREGSFEFVDNYTNKITGRQKFFPAGTVLAGKRIR